MFWLKPCFSGEEDIRMGRRLLSPDQIFEELVSQRLAKVSDLEYLFNFFYRFVEINYCKLITRATRRGPKSRPTYLSIYHSIMTRVLELLRNPLVEGSLKLGHPSPAFENWALEM